MSSAYTRACWSTAESGFSVRLDHSRPCSNVLIEAGDDAKVVAPAAERQPQVRVLLLASLDNGAVGENNLERNDLIAGLALPRAKVGDAAAAAEPCHADAGNTAARGAEPQRIQRLVDGVPCRAGADRRARLVAADDDRVEAAHVECDSGATGRASEPLVPAAPDGKLASGGSHGLDHAGYIAGRPGRDEALGMEARDLRAKIRRKRCGVCVASRKQGLVGTEGGLQGCTRLVHCEKNRQLKIQERERQKQKEKKGFK